MRNAFIYLNDDLVNHCCNDIIWAYRKYIINLLVGFDMYDFNFDTKILVKEGI